MKHYLYSNLAKYYDIIYSKKDYAREIDFVISQAKKNKIKGKEVLDVCCGTGSHDIVLAKKGFSVTGIDLSKDMLKIARKKVKKAKYIVGNMKNFNLHKQFDIALILFSSSGYMRNYSELKTLLKNLHRHLKKGGMLIFDLGFTEERWIDGGKWVDRGETKDVFIARVSRSSRKGSRGKLEMNYVIYDKNKTIRCDEEHFVGIFSTLKVKKIADETGFRSEIFSDFTIKPWKGKMRPVFVCVKK